MAHSRESGRPNFVLFVTDQHKADHLGCYGDRVVSTPRIDALARDGRVFDDFHVASPICQPNRASLMTGRLPSAHGVLSNGRELSLSQRTFVDMLREAGWRTALVGKSHLQNITDAPAAWPGPGEERLPLESVRAHPGAYGQEVWRRWNDDPAFELQLPYYGFEHVQLTIGHADEQHGHWRRWLRQQLPDADRLIGPDHALPTPDLALRASRQAWRTRLPEELHPTRWIADRCCDWIAQQAAQEQPFFIQCSFPDPHHPFTPPGRFWDLVRPGDVPLPDSFAADLHDAPPPVRALRQAAAAGQARKGGHGAFAASEQEIREALALNHGSIAFIDEAVGRVVATLERLGLADDTVLVFTADHGELLGDRGLMLKGGLHYRSLTRVPFIWRDTAGRREPGRTSELAQTIDIAPSVLDRAGLAPANGMQGCSLLPLVQGQAQLAREQLLVEEEGQRRDFGLRQRPRLRTLLTRRHRLTVYADEPWGELVDLRDDPLELRNLWHAPEAQPLKGELALQLAATMARAASTSPYPSASA
ncbi:sulfatase-like hydrolase/transferase [Ramlibacter sp. AW1]|uniref:Sulfatase-like hydrolase/transferase n=1 Tax=Ramlibacter aurantiacus TaxID=2801330 RepID=A0A937D658_9BURK|nr:sulfatase-like hydrolase/transferase [Ramlibacter aurantiacus]MBL0422002.1 sulfatase-like hydrolase/transferase [Ramlibacter aurantiacus]